jgi:hypothetical protein
MSDNLTQRKIGTHFADVDKQRVTPVVYNEKKYEVFENRYDDPENSDSHWGVVTDKARPKKVGMADVNNHREIYIEQIERIDVLTGLEYEIHSIEDEAIFWCKYDE